MPSAHPAGHWCCLQGYWWYLLQHQAQTHLHRDLAALSHRL